MKIGVMQPYFFPYIGYWQLMNAVDTYVVLDDVNYINRGWINRNRLLINGQPQYFNILLSEASQNKKINEIEIIHDQNHIGKLYRMLELNYKKAPYYSEAMGIFEKVIENEEKNLALFLFDQIKTVAEYFDMDTNIILSSSIEKDNSLKGETKILDICHIQGGTEYINAIGGMELYTKEHFIAEDMTLQFLKTDAISYNQQGKDFVSGLSILDVMMNNSKDQVKELLYKYTLI